MTIHKNPTTDFAVDLLKHQLPSRIFDLAISDLEKSQDIINKWASKAIGLIDPELEGTIPEHEHYLQLYFHDCDETKFSDYHTVSPERNHIEQILNFSKSFRDKDHILIHCHAGISRSSAVAIAVLVQHGLEPLEAFERTERACPEMCPNKLILRYADELLGKNRDLIYYYHRWWDIFQQSPNYKYWNGY